ncbi:hypothetical protein [Streptomyces heilongjiangensis]|uniref:TIGR04222 domain-containing membrane protein n=1 Tax=Streptomyces heilongjiangensis TaxID=945052 RepID=A0ABW1B9Z4_9ACTN|nr:hypothetical protein [Streptomyces heilongjiangensis]MDC2946309.1 hypothetical protein [Streptomyces heilongjiangensis]
MATPFRLHPEDRPDFEAVLHLALNSPDVRNALRPDPTGRTTARLRVRARGDADAIVSAAQREYRAYLDLRTFTRESTEQHRPADAGLLPAVAVLTPPVAASSSAILLVLGYTLQLMDVEGTLPDSLVTAGWTLALVASISAYVAMAGLVTTAVRRRGGSPPPARLEQTRLAWQQALLTQGMLPHLRRYLSEEQALRPAAQPPADFTTDSPADVPPAGR